MLAVLGSTLASLLKMFSDLDHSFKIVGFKKFNQTFRQNNETFFATLLSDKVLLGGGVKLAQQ